MTISHAIYNISNYRKRYGIRIALKAIIHYAYVTTKRIRNNKVKDGMINVNGYQMKVDTNDIFGTSGELITFKIHEPVSTKLISKNLCEGMTCLDIGGNIGYYVMLEWKMIGKEGKIIAIEPSPVNFEFLKSNIELMGAKNIDAFKIAAGEKDGVVNFLITEIGANSCMVIPDGEEPRWAGKLIKVPVRRMDSFLKEIGAPKIDFLRMDCEGYENNVMVGLSEILSHDKPIIQIEVHINIMGKDVSRNFFKMLQKFGYEIKYYVPRDLDTPLIGTMRDVKNYTIDQVLKMLDDGTIPSFLMLTLVNKKNLND